MPKKAKGEPKVSVDDSYRPNLGSPSVKEAKILLTQRLEARGYTVKKVSRHDFHFIIHFGQTPEGKGNGPCGLSEMTCNWPGYTLKG